MIRENKIVLRDHSDLLSNQEKRFFFLFIRMETPNSSTSVWAEKIKTQLMPRLPQLSNTILSLSSITSIWLVETTCLRYSIGYQDYINKTAKVSYSFSFFWDSFWFNLYLHIQDTNICQLDANVTSIMNNIEAKLNTIRCWRRWSRFETLNCSSRMEVIRIYDGN